MPHRARRASGVGATPRALGGRFQLRGRRGITTGALPPDITSVAQVATTTAGASRRGRCSIATVRRAKTKRVIKRTYRCTIVLGKGSWTVTTTGRGASGVVAQSARAARVRK
ncbi:MAG: hypothetical protein ACOYL4_08325 [Miltoncostaeaceae bacterium]